MDNVKKGGLIVYQFGRIEEIEIRAINPIFFEICEEKIVLNKFILIGLIKVSNLSKYRIILGA
jgi:hypothetical protein